MGSMTTTVQVATAYGESYSVTGTVTWGNDLVVYVNTSCSNSSYTYGWRIRGVASQGDNSVYLLHTQGNSFTAQEGKSYIFQAVGGDGQYRNDGANSKFTVTKEVHTHSYSYSSTVAPTCTEQGYDIYYCSCGASNYQNYTSALGHSQVDTVVSPTCTEQGYTTHTCSRCGTDLGTDNYTNALGHSQVNTVISPTCTEQGYTTHTCSRCGTTLSANDTFTNALGHAWNSGEVIEEPTYTEEGTMKYTCTRCSVTRTEAIAKKVGSVRIYNGSTFDIYKIYVRGQDNSWGLYVPYIYNGSSWDLYS